MKRSVWAWIAAGAAALAALAACGGGGGDASGTGTLRLALTDAPACGYQHAWVTVEKVRVHRSDIAGPNDGGWSEVVLAAPQRIDLLEYTNGRVLPLGQTQLPVGTYTQMRLVLSPNTGANPLANAIQPVGSSADTALDTPSGQQSGLKANVNLTVNPDTVADFVIDFSACKSFVKAGNSGKYLLKPVLSVYPVISSKIVGWVDSAIAASAEVSMQSQGEVLRATRPETTTGSTLGRFELAWVPAGTYELVITAPGRVNAVMTGVPVTAAGATTIGSDTARVTPSADADVRALQTLTGGTKVEVSYAGADSMTGAYSMTLPRDALYTVRYVAGATTFTFTLDPATIDKYTLQSRSGSNTLMRDITLPVAAPENFNFP